jgi:hypothetical protein
LLNVVKLLLLFSGVDNMRRPIKTTYIQWVGCVRVAKMGKIFIMLAYQ